MPDVWEDTEEKWEIAGHNGIEVDAERGLASVDDYARKNLRTVSQTRGGKYIEFAVAKESAGELRDYLNALQQENADLAKKAALADEEWAGDEDGFITRDDDSMGRKKEFCVVCLVSLHGKQVGQRPFPHSKRCRKARYDALTKDAITSEEIEG